MSTVAVEKKVADILISAGLTMTTAESCTGGLISARMVNVPGVSNVFKSGFVTYANEAKQTLLGVKAETLRQFGAVSPQTAEEMARGAAFAAKADVAVAVTGIAGPDGGTLEKPVGLVYIGCFVCGAIQVKQYYFTGDRMQVRESTAEAALGQLLECLQQYITHSQMAYMQQPYVGPQQNGYAQQPVIVQQPVVYQQPFMTEQSGYGNSPAYQTPKKSSVWVVILILLLVLVLTILVLFIGIRSILNDSYNKTADVNNRYEWEEEERTKESLDEPDAGENDAGITFDDEESEFSNEDDIALEGEYYREVFDVTENNRQEAGQDESLPYYSGPYNALNDNLSYEIAFTEQILSSESGAVYIDVEYPQIISGAEEYSDYINETLRYEYDYFYELFAEEFEPLMENEEDRYLCYVDSYATYMDEKLLSIVFREEMYMQLENDSFSMLAFECVNIDMENGTILENTEILYLDEAFAIDFREREVMENGDEALTAYTDQEILEMLKNPSQLVAFYTPYGMEIGLNLEDMVVYVMYEDYQNFINNY